MATADRKDRNARTTALTCGLIALVELAGVLFTWSASATPLGRETFGNTASTAVVVAAMAALVLAMIVLVARPPRALLLTVAAVLAVTVGAAAVLAFASLGDGVGILLLTAWALTLPVLLGVTRARDQQSNRG